MNFSSIPGHIAVAVLLSGACVSTLVVLVSIA